MISVNLLMKYKGIQSLHQKPKLLLIPLVLRHRFSLLLNRNFSYKLRRKGKCQVKKNDEKRLQKETLITVLAVTVAPTVPDIELFIFCIYNWFKIS